jgi:hypothetical protein
LIVFADINLRRAICDWNLGANCISKYRLAPP